MSAFTMFWDYSQPGLALAYTIEDGEIIFGTFIDLCLAHLVRMGDALATMGSHT